MHSVFVGGCHFSFGYCIVCISAAFYYLLCIFKMCIHFHVQHHRHLFHSKNICLLLFLTSALFPFPTSPQYVSLICDPFADPIISLHSPDIILFSTATFKYTYRAPLRRIGFFICIRNSLDRPCVTMPS